MISNLAIFTDAAPKREAIRRQLAGAFALTFFDLDHIHAAETQPHLLFDINFRNCPRLLELKEWLNHKPKDGKVVFVTDKASHVQAIQARALGATDIVHRPLDASALVKKLSGDFDAISSDDPENLIKERLGVGTGLAALHDIFASACLGAPLDLAAVNTAGESIIGHIEELGLKSWIDTVRKHHNQTYQHCLLVTGVAVAFGQHLGFSHADRNRLSFAGMVHDIGKARVPIAILEKPTPLNEDEMAVLRKHPEFGLEALKSTSELSPDMLDVVIHHHEYLDGSGYPHGLSGSEISDFVRIGTICDVFGALLERRAYKAPIHGEIAYQMLLEMGPKLDKHLVREFRFASALQLEGNA
jgi:putative nucleotidyltransferase with HDIG domain